MFSRQNIRQGFLVYSSDNNQVGTISDVGNTHLKCDSGFLGLGKDLYIPFTFVDRVQGDKLYLSVMKDRISQMNWDRQPVGWMV